MSGEIGVEVGWELGGIFVMRHAGMPFEWVESLGGGVEVLEACAEVLAVEEELVGVLGDAGLDVVGVLAGGGAPSVPRRAKEVVGRWREAFGRLGEVYAAELVRLRGRLRELAGTDRFKDAVFTSNPGMYEGMVAGYLALADVPDTAKYRRVERQLYNYLQRFCAKNETASAYGPMGYGEVAGTGFAVEPAGPPVRRAFVAHWAALELARAAARDKALAPHIPVRLSLLAVKTPTGITTDGRSSQGTGEPGAGSGDGAGEASEVPLPPGSVAARVVGVLEEKAAGVAGVAAAIGVPVRAVAEAVRELMRAGVVVRALEVPGERVDSLQGLRESVGELPESPGRERWLGHLDRLGGICERFAAAAGDVDTRRAVLAELENAFTELTGVAARRGAGAVYADRLVLFEEGASPFKLVVGQDTAERLARALTPALELSAAFGDQVQDGHRSAMAELIEAAGGSLGFTDYAARARPEHQEGSRFSPVRPVDVPAADGEPVKLAADALGTAEPGPRYALPDVCLAMTAPEEAVDGSWRVLLARVHHHLLLRGWLTTFHPDPDAFDRVAADWLAGDGAGVAGLATSRRNKGFYRFPGQRLVFNATDPDRRTDNLPATGCEVTLRDGRPVLLDPRGHPRTLYPMLNDLTTYPPFAALSHPSVLHAPVRGDTGHLGRVTIGDACYQRERWVLDAAALPAGGRGPAALLGLRRLARTHGLPRFVFARTEAERKPVLVDTASPFAAELLAHLMGDKAGSRVLVEEMYPGPDELWLRDDAGRYTCELRMQLTRPR
ncbi:lantibiotic dehydratase [Sphaerisporangium aureirubrum]|uniref:Lantibiotic dehydratase n=1 Tax=Sphaerisporangium aureirubrum TaxID=1544736 RepID=A0ABW1NQ53_9ACTN